MGRWPRPRTGLALRRFRRPVGTEYQVLAVIAGFLLQATALSGGELAVVEPVLVLELPATLILASWVFRSRLRRREWSTTAATAAGLAGLMFFLAPSAGRSAPSAWYVWVAGILINLTTVGVLVAWARHRGQTSSGSGRRRPARAARARERRDGRAKGRPQTPGRRRPALVLWPARHQEAGVGGPGDRRLPLPWRPGRCFVRRGARRGADRQAAAGPRRQGCRGRGGRAVARRAGEGPGPAGAVPEHDAGVQADLADERRHLDPFGLRPAAFASAASELTGLLPGVGLAATGAAAALGPALASYTGVLLAGTAVPAWHEARGELPFLFVASAAAAAGGLGLACAADDEIAPVRYLALVGGTAELAAETIWSGGSTP